MDVPDLFLKRTNGIGYNAVYNISTYVVVKMS